MSQRSGAPGWFLVVAAAAAASCKPDLDDRTALVEAPRVLAVRATPAEAAPGEAVLLEALVAWPEGASAPGVSWALCHDRKPLTEPGALSPSCLLPAGPALEQAGSGPSAPITLPDEACRRFGPDTPAPLPGEPPGRPVDPDATGGFYQPGRLLLDGSTGPTYSSFEVRLSCGLPGATPDQGAEMRRRYARNQSPSLSSIAAWRGGAWAAIDGSPLAASPGERLALRASWPSCPPEPPCDQACPAGASGEACDACKKASCAGAEAYVAFDPGARAVVVRRESMRVGWFATSGSFEADRTGREADDQAAFSDDAWTAPDAPGDAVLWVVLRDDRGGTGWVSFRVAVR